MRKRQNKEPKRSKANTKSVREESALSPRSIAAAITEEEPLPMVMAEMALWGADMSALMIPIAIMGLLAAPFAAVGNVFRPAAEALN